MRIEFFYLVRDLLVGFVICYRVFLHRDFLKANLDWVAWYDANLLTVSLRWIATVPTQFHIGVCVDSFK